jgi:hypothetical protein
LFFSSPFARFLDSTQAAVAKLDKLCTTAGMAVAEPDNCSFRALSQGRVARLLKITLQSRTALFYRPRSEARRLPVQEERNRS